MTGSKRGLPDKRRMRHDRHYVDELAQRMGEGIGRMIRVTNIIANQDQPRSNLGDFSDLVASIERHGILEPLLVRKIDQGQYELVSGERRFHAAMQAELTEVPCIELQVSDQHALEIALIENLQHQDLNAFEEAEGFRTLIEKYRYTHDEVGTAVGRSRVTITETLRLLTIPEEVRNLCRHADIQAKSLLLEIAKAPDLASMTELVQAIVEDKLDRKGVRDLRAEMAGDGADAVADPPAGDSAADSGGARPRPFVWRYQPKDRPFKISLSFRTEEEPDPADLIAALEEILRELREAAPVEE